MKQLASALTSCLIVFAATNGFAQETHEGCLDELLPPPGIPLEIIKMPAEIPAPQQFEDGSWLLVPPSTDWISMMLIHYTYMPALFERYRERNDDAWRTVVKAVGDVARAGCTVDLATFERQEAAGWDTWEVVLFTAVGVALGAAIGIAVGYAANDGPVVIR